MLSRSFCNNRMVWERKSICNSTHWFKMETPAEMGFLLFSDFYNLHVYEVRRITVYLFPILIKMKKFVLNTVAFLLFSLVFYVVVLFLWGNYIPLRFKPNLNYKIGSYGHLYTRLNEVKNTKNVDILFLGSSHAYRGFDTRMYSKIGLKTFNLGSSAQTPTQTNVLLQRYLENLNPKLIVYEVYPKTFTIDGVESSLDIIANDRNDKYSLAMAFKINNVKTYTTLLYGAMRDLFNMNTSFKEPIINAEDTYIPGGFVQRRVDHFKPIPFEKTEISISPTQLETFSEIMASLKAKNIDVVLVYAPIPPSNYKSFTNNEYFDNLMKKYGEYYNFNELIHLNDSMDFYDSHHLNQNGVEVFNEKLIDILNSRKSSAN